jgi:hypothetical protein
MPRKWHKAGKTRKKPVETEEIRLTNASERMKVKCGTVSPDPHEHWRFAYSYHAERTVGKVVFGSKPASTK